ncbi:MAG: potassium-transporting ATPase subunit KdpC [Bacteroidota bacterium]
MKNNIWTSIRMIVVLTILTGILYPLLLTVFAQWAFPHRANGSMVEHFGNVAGSELLSQKTVGDKYFWPRPSAVDWNPLPSGGSNFGPTSKVLADSVRAARKYFIEKNNLAAETIVPKEMLFASGSGLDPHISPEAALLQVGRIAAARALDSARTRQLKTLVQKHIEYPQFGIFGEERVNVLLLNCDLDSEFIL